MRAYAPAYGLRTSSTYRLPLIAVFSTMSGEHQLSIIQSWHEREPLPEHHRARTTHMLNSPSHEGMRSLANLQMNLRDSHSSALSDAGIAWHFGNSSLRPLCSRAR